MTRLMSYSTIADFMRSNNDIYQWLVERAQSVALPEGAEEMLCQVSRCAAFAAAFHTGRFADGAIENLGHRIGTILHDLSPPDAIDRPVLRDGGRRRVLHVASRVVGIGGHTRMIYNWVRNDGSSCHSLIVTNQMDRPIPQFLQNSILNNGGDLIAFSPKARLLEKARRLRDSALRFADLVVLHHDADDVVPSVAFATKACPPVAVLNHADHQFWLGSSVSDMVINLRSLASEHTTSRRFVPTNAVLPVPLEDKSHHSSREDARRALGIPSDQIVLLSVGRPEKFRPCGTHDFISTAGKILDDAPCAHVYIVGESRSGIAPHLRSVPHERLHFVGALDDPSLYRIAADLYLESFPFGSQTALLESALVALPVVSALAPLFPLLVANDDAINDLIPNPQHEADYIDQVKRLVHHSEERCNLGHSLRARILIDHLGEGWVGRLARVYKLSDTLIHNPQPIPTSPSDTSPEDLNLSLWRVVANGRTYSPDNYCHTLFDLFYHRVFISRVVGNFTLARKYAWRAMRHDPLKLASWRLLLIACLGKWAEVIRRWTRRSAIWSSD